MRKYDDTPERRRLATTRIPLIDRAWTEVVFLSPVHPRAIWQTWLDVSGSPLPRAEFWEIPVELLPDDAVILDRTVSAVGDPIDLAELVRFDAERFRTALQTTAANRAWLAKLAAGGLRGAYFHGIPHVLTAGPVPLKGARLISWDAAPPVSR
ncbi:hypothetical protein [Microbacterium sp.]|uniref:hypothetical protein n=1 Tax=Microbacterium sp. TaxID=51671 RepID=UPI0025F8CB86|nr:hypothetical protein [Microbacterium sp.]